MRVGTPNFCGSRLSEAREARGLTQTALSELTDIKVSSLSQYEQGKQTPSPEALRTLAQTLKQPEKYFLRPVSTFETAGIRCRSQATATKSARIRAFRKLGWQREMVMYLSRFVEFPDVRLPDFTLPTDPTAISFEQIEEVADETRRFWDLGFGPIDNLIHLLENHGVIVARLSLEAETLDAFSHMDEELQRPFVFLSSDKDSAARSRFDAAHELGHLVLHSRVAPKASNVGSTYKLMEDQAHRFAASFLLPERSFTKEIWAPTLDAFASLKKTWRVSIATMISRSSQLGLINEEQARRMWINLSRKQWRVVEPFDRTIPAEEPILLRNTFEMLIQDAGFDKRQLLNELGMNATDVEDICHLPKGFFNMPRLVGEPKVRLRSESQEQAGTVLEFKAR